MDQATEKPVRQYRAKRAFRHLYHLADAVNIDSILESGLMSADELLRQAGYSDEQRASMLREHRRENLILPEGFLIRDQSPMPPGALARALDDGLEPADWYEFLNSFVFLWPDRARMERQRKACGARPQVLLTFDAEALIEKFGDEAFVSPINSGNAMRKAARRGTGTLIPFRKWQTEGWPTGKAGRSPAEFLFRCGIPVAAPYLLSREDI